MVHLAFGQTLSEWQVFGCHFSFMPLGNNGMMEFQKLVGKALEVGSGEVVGSRLETIKMFGNPLVD